MCRHTANCIDSRVAADVLGSAAIGADAAHQLIRFSVSAWRFLLRPLDSLGPRLALVCADATLAPSPNLLLATVTEPPMACDEDARHTNRRFGRRVAGRGRARRGWQCNLNLRLHVLERLDELGAQVAERLR